MTIVDLMQALSAVLGKHGENVTVRVDGKDIGSIDVHAIEMKGVGSRAVLTIRSASAASAPFLWDAPKGG